jgi:hypothetical protein
MKFSERNLEDIIFDTPSPFLQERGLDIQGAKLRQVRLGIYGIADLITIKKVYLDSIQEDRTVKRVPVLIIDIFELKQGKISFETYTQILKYGRGVKSYLNKYHPNLEYGIRYVMIGDSVDKDTSFYFLPSLYKNIKFYKYNYDYDGIRFLSEGRHIPTHDGLSKELTFEANYPNYNA